MVVNDKLDKYLHILCIHDIHFFFVFLSHTVHLHYLNCLKIFRKFSNVFIEKNPHVNGPVPFKPVPFMGQLE